MSTKFEPEQAEQFAFKKHDDIGTAAAEDDSQYLDDCFIDTGDLDQLVDCKNPRRIIVGRTGAGKSALISRLEKKCRNVVRLLPQSLSLNFIANNSVLNFFENAGVNLSAFYGLLWRHVLVVELLKKRFNIVNEESHKNYIRSIRSLLYRKDQHKEMAVDYLEQWGEKFWLTTEDRIHELTGKIEQSLSNWMGERLGDVELSAEGASRLTLEQKKEVQDKGQRAASEIHIRELENMITVLAENVFDDPKINYYVAIDTLDDDWVDDRIRFKLIKALIDTIRHFKKIPNVKIIAALRHDLLTKVLADTHVPGFQEEKYTSLYLDIRWNKKDLQQLVEKRLNVLVKRRYTKKEVLFEDVFPNNVDSEPAIDYLALRTFLRPRDIILFVNDCIALSVDKPVISVRVIKQAEELYSQKRLQSLATEWQLIYPNLFQISQLLYGMKERFPVSDLTKEFIEDRFPDIAAKIDASKDPVSRMLESLYTPAGNFISVREYLVKSLYIVGLVGIKAGSTSSVSYSFNSSPVHGEIRPASYIQIHPMFHRALCIQPV